MVPVRRLILDASIATKWLLNDEDHVDRALGILESFGRQEIDLLAPTHIRYEVPSAIRNALLKGRLTADQARVLIDRFTKLTFPTLASDDLLRSAFEESIRYDCAFYDGVYVALARATGFHLVHADSALHRRHANRFPLELWIEDYLP